MAHISVVIPVFNAERTLGELYDRLVAALSTISDDFQIVLVEDGGTDRSWDGIVALASRDTRVKGVRFSRNFGQHHGLTAGIDVCDGDWVVLMDCDLQDAPEEIPRLYAKGQEGYDVVLARRAVRQDPLMKKAFSWLFYRLFGYLTSTKWDDRVGVFRLMSRPVAEQLRAMREQLRFIAGLVDWMGFPTTSLDVHHSARSEGTTHYTPRRLLRLAIGAIIAHSDKPLRLAVQLGFLISTLAFVFGAGIIGRFFLYGNPITGWSSLIVAVFFMGGIIVCMLGILGVYLGKVFDEVKQRPLYVVRSRVNL
jgi:dolichol-phosphate mannosyltransferase